MVCADISLSKKTVEAYKNVPNISFIEANIMDMKNIEADTFDTVIVQKVIHHLAEKNHKKTVENTRKAVSECLRVMKPGGVLIVCESTVRRWFECLEIVFFKPMLRCCDLVKFDRVYQYSPGSLKNLLLDVVRDKGHLERYEEIGAGESILFLGRKLPSKILPCGVTYYTIRKEEKG